MYTFGYSFKPWVKDELATAEQIRAYLREVIDENNLGPYIRYQQRVTAASWSSDTRQWTVEVTRQDTGERLRYSADFVWMCQGHGTVRQIVISRTRCRALVLHYSSTLKVRGREDVQV